jgi:hypothetical protein
MQRALLQQQAQQPEEALSHPTVVSSGMAPVVPSAADIFASASAPAGTATATDAAPAAHASDPANAVSKAETVPTPTQAPPEASSGPSVAEEEAAAPPARKEDHDDVDDGMLDDIPLSPEAGFKPTIGATAGASDAAPTASDISPPPAAS